MTEANERVKFRRALLETRASALSPPSRLKPSEWGERNLQLSSQNSGKPGPLRFFPYQKGIIDAAIEPGVEEIHLMKSARVGLTQGLAVLETYFMEHTASPILSIFPTERNARDFEKDYIRTLIQDNDCLAEIMPDLEDQEWHTKTTARRSVLRLRQAVIYNNFRAYNARFAAADEIDASEYNKKGGEGDKLALLLDRTKGFDDGVMMTGSTPTIAGKSRAEENYLRGDQRRRFLPCPHCGEFQYLEWGGPDVPHGIKWPTDEPEKAYYVCKHNGCVIEHDDKARMDEAGEWRPTANGEPGVVSFHISALYSPFKKYSWGKLAREFVEAQKKSKKGDFGRLQAFINTVLGETWKNLDEEKGLRKPHELSNLCQIYQAPVPYGVRFLTFGGDTQSGKKGSGGYRVGAVYGWGVREKPYLIAYYRIDHPIETAAHDAELTKILTQPYRGEDGRDHYIQAACIDGGGDYQTQTIDFCRASAQKIRMAQRWFPIKGWGRDGERKGPIWKTPIGTAEKTYSVDVNQCKDTTFNKLHGKDRDDLIVFPMASLPGSVPIDADFFEGMTKEKKEYPHGSNGIPVWQKKVKGNEPWDCLQYAYAAVQALKSMKAPNQFMKLLYDEDVAPAKPAPSAPTSDAPVPKTVETAAPAPQPPKRKKKRGFRQVGRR